MRPSVRALVADPLTHFAVLGTAAFAIHAASAPPADAQVRVSGDTMRALNTEFEGRVGRPATAAERESIARAEARNEVLVREARALGLDRSDPIVRRRLAQRMRFVLEDSASIPAPTEDELQALLDANPARYVNSPRRGFTHVFVSSRHADATRRKSALLDRLNDGAAPAGLGDAFAHGSRFVSRADSRLERQFGRRFVSQLQQTEPGRWAPIESEFGWHLVRVDGSAPAAAPTVDAHRKRLTAQWREEHAARAVQEGIEALMSRYEVVVHP